MEQQNIIYEVVAITIDKLMVDDYKTAFSQAEPIIKRQDGYLGHTMLQHHDDITRFKLIIQWRSIDDHQIGFRQSEDYQEWKVLLHPFYDQEMFPVVEYFSTLSD